MTSKQITFPRTRLDFSSTLNKRVAEYFKVAGVSRHGNAEMVLKTVFMLSLYILPYLVIISGLVTSPIILLSMAVLMSFGLCGIGLAVMHDANHGAYSGTEWVNKLLGYSLNLIGATSFNWKIQHNVLHHTFTNVHEEDEDIISRGVFRLTPYNDWKSFHRFQHIYAWFLYGLMTMSWMVVKDFLRIVKYHRNGLAKKQKANMVTEWIILLITKSFYLTYMFILPVMLTDLAWWQILIGIAVMHYIAGFILAIIFQPAHIISGAEFPLPDKNNMLENNWNIHQLVTTTNFGDRSKLFSWCIGGLNFQIEHHLFPNVCHVHYHKIAGIVKETALEYDLPYKDSLSFFAALKGHAQLLKSLGRNPLPTTGV
ncbi:MAG: acyl-CoA desaturase [Chryseolinea sp.]